MSFLIELIKNIIGLVAGILLLIAVVFLAVIGAVFNALEEIVTVSKEEFKRARH